MSSLAPFLRSILAHSDFAAGNVHTRWVDEHMAVLVADGADQRRRFVETARPAANDGGFAGARIKSRDPLALFTHDAQVKTEQATADVVAPEMTGPDGSADSDTIRRAVEIRDGLVENPRILSFQKRDPTYPHR